MAQVSPLRRRMIEDMTVRNMGIVSLTSWECAAAKGGQCRLPRDPLYRRHRFPPEVISYAVWLYFRFPLSLRMVEEMLAAREFS